MNELRQRWQAMSPRERQLMVVCAAVLLLCLVYYAILQPWLEREELWERTISREQQTVNWMQKQAPSIPQGNQAQGENSQRETSLPILISQSTQRYGLTVARLQPQGNQASVTLAQSDFNSLLRWLSELEQQNGVRVVSLDVNAVEQSPGMVDVTRLMLERADEG
ncbi:type II secretion system protein M [Pectobacterium parmentieri]|uniref:type II secretion system protein GspM n=1 Tax=Pectobacterium parmentieri TaxID=1905730 RepID=UPI0001B0C7E6|nr:type II secretion system protein M [Pectobacterium parmentieri]ACX87220.1 General secretion pathway M protein [Pectobacterium parmentieri WPP163]AYH00678.1 type II secretion system protein M [Pectobacterium parmentieri]AYH05140.1 type II secretion system protein M [Pectobacterium parmentieri]AYH13961.1 type II secretion system protein M [Pectobacterium parmentieri]AYH19836.1 type II secretion system protein M [Pectobacterium parmentieri]